MRLGNSCFAALCTAALAAMAIGYRPSSAAAQQLPAAASKTRAGEWNLGGSTPHLIAHYMPWFLVHPEDNPKDLQWRHWGWGGKGVKHDPKTFRADGARDTASVFTPLIGPYNSWDASVIRYHLQTARAAGIQGIVIDWYGPGSDTDRCMPRLLDVARQVGMKVAICYEEKANWPAYRHPKSRADLVDAVTADLKYIVKTYGSHPAYIRRNGQPFIMQFNCWGKGELGSLSVLPEEWKTIFARVGRPVAYMRQNLDWDQHPPVPGAYVWWNPNFQYVEQFARDAQKLREAGRLEFSASMICPGFDDTGVWGWGDGPRVTPRHGTDLLEQTMQRATLGSPELVQIVTWNDFEEGTVIEPTRENGFAYLDAIETWWHGVSGRPVNLQDNRQPLRELLAKPSEYQREEIERSRTEIQRILAETPSVAR